MSPPNTTAPRLIGVSEGAGESTTGAGIVPQADLADDINNEHALAQQCAETAVQHAVKCGQLLLEVKAGLKHGEFMPWIEGNCKFSQATANNYMKASQNPNALGKSIRHLFPSGATRPQGLAGPKTEPTVEQVEEDVHHHQRGGGGGVVDDNPETQRDYMANRALRDKAQRDALLIAWRNASLGAQARFISSVHKEIGMHMRALKKRTT